jgi:formate/nitrite transporter FocA (FNT family)
MIKKWFKDNLRNFLISLTIPIGLILIIFLTTDVVTSVLVILIYISILSDKIIKNKTF